jgi:predicted nucleic-acid-binding Zn-ribbon protein
MKNWLKILVVCCLLLITTALTYARNDKDSDNAPATAAGAADALKCPKCQNQMEDGFLLDQQGYDAQYTNSLWVEGPVKKKFIGGIETKVRRPILAYRCTNCGYLEMYAK